MSTLHDFDPVAKMEAALNKVIFERECYMMGYPGKANDPHTWDKSTITRIGRAWNFTFLERGLSSFITITTDDENARWIIDLTQEGKALLDANGYTKAYFETAVKPDQRRQARRAIRQLFIENGL